jgi:hypothetical protein
MTSKAQRVVYIGKETAPGDGATVDVALRAKASLKAVPDIKQPDEDIGSLAPARHYIGSLKAEGTLEVEAAYYEHLPYFVSPALGAGSVNITGSPELWTFTLSQTSTPPTFATYNMEVGDGDNHIVRASDVFSTAMEISGEAGEAWAIKNTIVGGNVTFPAAHGATPTPPATVRTVLMADTALKFADDGDFGSASAVEMTLISFTWKLEEYMHQKQFAGALYPNARGNNKWKVTLEMMVEIGNATIESQKDKLLVGTQTSIQIRAEAADAGGAGVDWYAEIRGAFYLSEVGELDDRDGNNIIKLVYVGEKDETATISSQILIGTSLTAL